MDVVKFLKEKYRMTKNAVFVALIVRLPVKTIQLVCVVAICRECIQRLQFLLWKNGRRSTQGKQDCRSF